VSLGSIATRYLLSSAIGLILEGARLNREAGKGQSVRKPAVDKDRENGFRKDLATQYSVDTATVVFGVIYIVQ
jgi:hypothetical protein